MNPTLILGLIVAGGVLGLLLIMAFVVTRFLRQVDQGKAIIINTWGKGAQVSFSGVVVYPIVNRAEMMDISVKTIDIDRRGKEGPHL